uniref:Uncharacterized protein n=1 Tax=Pseudoalteromonas rubra TaxID=43658 RepID=A0A0F4QA02_9GAMM|nr:hypothetical protein TW77_23660 [Pseudoalteromonas rubra]
MGSCIVQGCCGKPIKKASANAEAYLLVELTENELNQLFDEMARIEDILQDTSLGHKKRRFEPKTSRYMNHAG